MLVAMLVGLVAAAPPETGDAVGEPMDSAWLDWRAPEQCPDAERVQAAIVERLDRPVAPGDIEVHARVADDGPQGYRLELRTRKDGVDDRRELWAHDCGALADATGLIVALTIDAVRVASTIGDISAAAQSHSVPPPAVPVPLEQPRVATVEPAPQVQPSRVAGGAAGRDRSRAIPFTSIAGAGGVVLGTLPGVSGGLDLAVALVWPRLRLELGGTWLAPRVETAAPGAVRVQLGAVTPRACARVGSPRVEVPLCAGLELGAMRGQGSDAPGARTAHGLWVAPVVGAGVRGWVTGAIAVFLRLDLSVPVVHPEFQLEGPDDALELFRAEPVGGRLWVGVEGKIAGGRDGSRRPRRTTR